MTGHPWITFNKGRIGFGYDDYLAYAPEQKQPLNLAWIAVSNDCAQFQSVTGLEKQEFLEKELGKETLTHFEATLQDYGVNPQNYHFLPIHAWQWQNVIIALFAEDIAQLDSWSVSMDGQYALSDRFYIGGNAGYDSSDFPNFTRKRFSFKTSVTYRF